jgi:hypothetical protein
MLTADCCCIPSVAICTSTSISTSTISQHASSTRYSTTLPSSSVPYHVMETAHTDHGPRFHDDVYFNLLTSLPLLSLLQFNSLHTISTLYFPPHSSPLPHSFPVPHSLPFSQSLPLPHSLPLRHTPRPSVLCPLRARS